MILVIDNYDSFTYNLVQQLGAFGHRIEVLRGDRFEVADLLKLRPTHLIISPGPGRPEGAGHSIAVIQQFHGRIPVLGVCLGHQAIAVAAGASVIRAQELMHGKASKVQHCRRDLFQDLASPLLAARYHSLVVSEDSLPKELDVQARSEDGTIMALRWGSAPTFGLQFHPESILTDQGPQLLLNFLRTGS